MADKQDRWLDRETAERLLRGESPGHALDGAAGEQAERLARTLGALSALAAEPLPADDELPGEAAALAAFRKAYADRADTVSPIDSVSPAPGAALVVDAGLVRIGGGRGREGAGRRARWSRPAQLGLAAVLAVGMVGGVAVAAGTGVLPTPFDDAEPVSPAVSAPALPEGPLVSPAPDASGDDASSPAPDDDDPGDTGSEAAGEAGKGDGNADDHASTAPDLRGTWPAGVTSSCRDLGAGKTLDTDRRRILENLAGGSQRVPKYCAGVLDGTTLPGNSRGDDRTGKGSGRGSGKGTGKDTSDRGTGQGQGGSGQSGGSGDGDDDSGGDRGSDRGGHDGRHGGASAGSGGNGGSGGSGGYGQRRH